MVQAQEATHITLTRLFEELGRVGLCDPKDLCEPDGGLETEKASLTVIRPLR